MTPDAPGELRFSDVESRRFGLRLYRGTFADLPEEGLLQHFVDERIDVAILRLPADKADQLARLTEAGLPYHVADTLVVYTLDLHRHQITPLRNQALRFVPCGAQQHQALEALVGRIFVDYRNHYSANPLLARDLLAGYQEWACSFAGAEAEGRRAWLVEREGTPIGFATCRFDGSECEGVLYGVLPEAAGGGVYGDIIRFTQGFFQKAGLRTMTVSTQVHNYAVQKVWAREGFHISRALLTVHVNSLFSRSVRPAVELPARLAAAALPGAGSGVLAELPRAAAAAGDRFVIPFNKPFIVGKELAYIAQAVQDGHLAGDGSFTRRCHRWMEERFGVPKVLLTHSCTAALEMAALLADFGPGDEVILPSYTFVSTANAFVLRGARPVFVDIRPDTLNIDERLIPAAITERTRAIVPVHYAGVGCEMDAILAVAKNRDLVVIEDAAQAVQATYKGRYLGTLGHLGCYSFHETKNFIAGEGGALAIADPRFVERAEILREKGTNRAEFFRGQVDKYTWVDLGSSFLPSELTAAFLAAQLEEADTITQRRHAIWSHYQTRLTPLAEAGLVRLPVIPSHCGHNAHLFYLLVDDLTTRTRLLAHLKERGILAVFHYVPLHTSPMGARFGYRLGQLPVTEQLSERLVRLPGYFELEREAQDTVIDAVFDFFGRR